VDYLVKIVILKVILLLVVGIEIGIDAIVEHLTKKKNPAIVLVVHTRTAIAICRGTTMIMRNKNDYH
jgi:hypothetical protein